MGGLSPLRMGVGSWGRAGIRISGGPHGGMRGGRKFYFHGITPLGFQSPISLRPVLEVV